MPDIKAPSTRPDDRPTVRLLLSGGVPEKALDLMLQGLEEEGIPALASSCKDGAAEELAYRAASSSRLLTGIGVSAGEGRAALHHRDLPPKAPLLNASLHGNPASLRRLGLNAARLVKGQPFILDEPEDGPHRYQERPVKKAESGVRASSVVTPAPEVMALVERIMSQIPT